MRNVLTNPLHKWNAVYVKTSLEKGRVPSFFKMLSCLLHDCDWKQNGIGSSQVSSSISTTSSMMENYHHLFSLSIEIPL